MFPRKKRERRGTIAVSRYRAHTKDHPPHRHWRKRTRIFNFVLDIEGQCQWPRSTRGKAASDKMSCEDDLKYANRISSTFNHLHLIEPIRQFGGLKTVQKSTWTGTEQQEMRKWWSLFPDSKSFTLSTRTK